MTSDAVIIEVGQNEQVPRAAHPQVPITPQEIADDARRCRDAGASVVHWHARDPETGAGRLADAALYGAMLEALRGCDVLAYPTYPVEPDHVDGRLGHRSVVEVERPHRIVEAGRAGKNNRIRTLGVYELAPAALGSTRLRFTVQTMPATISDRLLESLGARAWLKRKTARAMRRLRAILEGEEARGNRVTVAGG